MHGISQSVLNQGDQIGRIFAFGAIVYFGQFLENVLATFSQEQSTVLIRAKNGQAYILGDFFPNASSHSD
jgi:hypothetical protein